MADVSGNQSAGQQQSNNGPLQVNPDATELTVCEERTCVLVSHLIRLKSTGRIISLINADAEWRMKSVWLQRLCLPRLKIMIEVGLHDQQTRKKVLDDQQ